MTRPTALRSSRSGGTGAGGPDDTDVGRYPSDVIVAAVLAGICLLAFMANLGQPLVRNSLVYARVAEHIIVHRYDPRPVVADSRLSYDKPILFSWLSAR
jgi:hypothetical protein